MQDVLIDDTKKIVEGLAYALCEVQPRREAGNVFLAAPFFKLRIRRRDGRNLVTAAEHDFGASDGQRTAADYETTKFVNSFGQMGKWRI